MGRSTQSPCTTGRTNRYSSNAAAASAVVERAAWEVGGRGPPPVSGFGAIVAAASEPGAGPDGVSALVPGEPAAAADLSDPGESAESGPGIGAVGASAGESPLPHAPENAVRMNAATMARTMLGKLTHRLSAGQTGGNHRVHDIFVR